MISLYERLRKSKVVVVDMETTGLVCGVEGKESDFILEIAAIRLEHLRPAETFHTYVSCPQPLAEEVTALTGITDEMLSVAPSVRDALEQFAAFAENVVLVGYNLPFDCKFLDFYGAQYGVTFPADRVDLLPIAKRLLGKSVQSYTLPAVWEELKGGHTDNTLETCMQCAEAAAWLAYFLSYWQRSRHNEIPFYRIVVPRRKIRLEIGHAEFVIAINLMRCALFGKDHPLFPLWVYKCAEKLEYVSKFVDKKDEKLPQRYYEMIFTGYNEAVWETKERLEGGGVEGGYFAYGEYEVTDELCERVFAIYDAVRVSCMPYLMSRTETYHPDEYASIIIQAVETEGKNREIKIDYDHLDRLYNGLCG